MPHSLQAFLTAQMPTRYLVYCGQAFLLPASTLEAAPVLSYSTESLCSN
ncbi:hypothetical protein [Emticicia sp. 17c]